MTFINIHSPEFTDQFKNAPIYTKFATVEAEFVTKPQKVTTIVGDGFLETEDIAPIGSYIVTNPDGERYILQSEKFSSRYTLLAGNLYQASGSIRAFRNVTNGDVEILAPWNAPQFGQHDCWFAISLDESDEMILKDRYIIEGTAFKNTYKIH